MKRIILVLAILTIVLFIGCASHGQYFTINDANRVENGMTREEVIAVMGTNPYQITDQGKTFVWSYAQVGFTGNTDSRAVRFNFDENGKTYGIPAAGLFGDTQKYLDRNGTVDLNKQSKVEAKSPDSSEYAQRLRKLKKLKDDNLITDSEYEQKRKSIIEGM